MKTTHVVITDDIDGSEGAETVSFAYQGVEYTIDLADKSAAKLEKALTPYLQAATRVGGRRRTTNGAGTGHGAADNGKRNGDGAVRLWAREHGYQVSDRGRLSAAVLAAYHAN